MPKTFKTKKNMLSFFVDGSKRYFIPSIIFVCFLVCFDLLNPRIIGYVVDFLKGDTDGFPGFVTAIIDSLGGRDCILSAMWIIALIIIGINLVGAVCRYAFKMFNALTAEHMVKHMRDTLFEKVMHLPFKWHDENKTGDIIQRLTSDIDMIKNFMSEQLTSLIRVTLLIIISIAFMVSINPLLALASSAFIPVILLYSLKFHKGIGSAFEKVDVEEGVLSSIAQENISGLRVVRAFGREKYERERFESRNENYTGMWIHVMKLLSHFWFVTNLICGAKDVLVISLGAYMTVDGQMTAGEYVSFIAYSGMMNWPLRQLGRTISELSKAGVSLDRLMYIMNSESEEDDAAALDYPGAGDIEFKNVTFGYTDDGKVLDNVSLVIPAGKTVGIIGATGSGKSSLVALLDDLYELKKDQGSIHIAGVDIRSIKKSELRKNIALILQETFLFSGSLSENLKIASSLSDEDMKAAVDTADLTSTIERFENHYDTFVGEKGVTLSGGQKQRVAIARALLRKSPVIIFDDSLSAVDAETDSRIRKALKESCKDSTVILISHRISSVMKADKIFVMDAGHIIESGTHEELLAAGGRYAYIYGLQSAGMEV
jgi:ATP-binding cassette subfamily B protein